VSAHSQYIDPTIFEIEKKPLTENDIQAVIKAVPQVNVPDLDEDTFKKIAKSYGLTDTRLNFAIIKSTYGVILELKMAEREDLLPKLSTPDALPTAAEQLLISKHLDALIEALDIEK
jgi:hypothetical protein